MSTSPDRVYLQGKYFVVNINGSELTVVTDDGEKILPIFSDKDKAKKFIASTKYKSTSAPRLIQDCDVINFIIYCRAHSYSVALDIKYDPEADSTEFDMININALLN